MSNLPTGNYIEAVRSSCRALVDQSPVNVSLSGVDTFLEKLDKAQYEELSIDTPMRLPLKFDSIAEELNLVALIDLLNFGSGYRVPLKQYTGRGAFDTIRFGAMGFHIGGVDMDAKTFKEMNILRVSELFDMPVTREVKAPNLDFVTMTEPNELRPLAEGITSVLNSTGEFLANNNYKDLASFILDITKPKSTAAAVVERLVKALPGLQDVYTINGQPVYVLKKAQLLVYHLWFIFRDQDPERFDFPDIHELTMFADNVIPTLLIHLGVIEIPDTWKQEMEQGKDVGMERAIILRAASIVAGEEITKKSKGLIKSEGDLDVYLWRLGKVGDYRKIERMAWRDTVMF
ncbi:hypothetical protein LRAMOSA10171 [Lichtheimia ramosa]|uniref:Queuosine 5'-phosphate N-glycosylase/hydrolase n=1 Tax=Lichtheimia ramosa TaxID=688394 RepID=A0A077WN54_9FUNG|nr:hypothetical protein LRAMOSA10171 [Lichtheimia ramosa]